MNRSSSRRRIVTVLGLLCAGSTVAMILFGGESFPAVRVSNAADFGVSVSLQVGNERITHGSLPPGGVREYRLPGGRSTPWYLVLTDEHAGRSLRVDPDQMVETRTRGASRWSVTFDPGGLSRADREPGTP